MKNKPSRGSLLSLAALLAPGALSAQDALSTITVIGTPEQVFELPGSGYVARAEDFRASGYQNVNRILARVPGVYTREENGYGLFPNISIRGGDGTRAEKVTIMEDGILSAPAPYSAPSAYYSPQAARMSAIEILKGSSQIQYGPQTTGGVINYLSTPVPEQETFYTRNTYGSNNEFFSHSYWGNTVDTSAGRVGYLLELFYRSSDGFRKIDSGTGYPGSDSTGFTLVEPMVKVFFEPNTALKQRFEFKYGFTDFDADESYTGLAEGIGGTPNDLRSNPDRRYAATRFDNMATQQHRTYFKHLAEFSENFSLETAIYYNQFERDWFKLDGLLDAGGNGISVRSALTNLTDFGILTGTAAGSLRVRHNARQYESYGAQVSGQYRLETGSVKHNLSFGMRYHEDYIERDQYWEIFDQGANGAIVDQRFAMDNVRRQESEAFSFWVKDEIKTGRLTVTPGVRFEYIDYFQRDYSEDKTIVADRDALAANRAAVTSTTSSTDLSEVIPGISFNYELTDSQVLFGGVHKGISVPGPRSAIGGTDIEESIGYELGTRYRCNNGLQAELVGFFTDFDNILNTNAGLGEGDAATNGGEADVLGLEALVTYNPLRKGRTALPMYFSATWTSAEFKNDINEGGGDNIFSGAEDGNEIPYIPEVRLATGIAYETPEFGVSLDATYVSETFGTGANEEFSATNPRQGIIDELFIVDLSGRYYLNENVTLLAGVQNLFDERGVVSRIPRGPRNNQGRSYYVGFEARF